MRTAPARPLPAVGGDFVLPGCEAGRTYRVLFLDAERRLGAVADLTAGSREGPAVVRLQPCGQATVRVIGAGGRPLAHRAVTGGEPPAELGTGGIVPVEASPPSVAVRVSDGPAGRLLVIAAEEEPGWVATIDGRQVPIVRAWNHLVAVSLPTRAAEVQVEQPTALRSVLLLTQAAMVLFTALTAIPSRTTRP